MTEGGALYIGEVVHQRLRPKRHKLRVRVFSILADIDRLADLDRGLRLFSVGRFNLFSLDVREFGPPDIPLRDFLCGEAGRAGYRGEVGRIRVLCYPKLLGYAFNPLTVFYLEDPAGHLVALVYEVHNTFGERHAYTALATSEATLRHTIAKAFYVSPFNTIDGEYRFTVRPPEADVFTGIVLTDAAGPLLNAYFSGEKQDLTDRALVKLALAYPFMTAKIVAAIHWNALSLWLKGVPLTLRLRRLSKPGPAPR
jgi:uncharacterized protein